jgi:hypothetical protein
LDTSQRIELDFDIGALPRRIKDPSVEHSSSRCSASQAHALDAATARMRAMLGVGHQLIEFGLVEYLVPYVGDDLLVRRTDLR